MGATDHLATIVLAGDRRTGDPVALAAGVDAKCLAQVAGVPMVFRVLAALEQSGRTGPIVLCGPAPGVVESTPALGEAIAQGRVRWMASEATPSTSAATALAALPEDAGVLLTTADHALLSPAMVRHFVDAARAGNFDVAAGLARHEVVRAAHPGTRRTVMRFSDGHFCGCNLFAFLTPQGRRMAQLWRQVEAQRKHPTRVIGLVGWGAVARYALGRLSLAGALHRLSRKTGLRVGVVEMPFAEAAIDVDTPADLDLARAIAHRGT